jgi:murein DD-endopeptidase MepM/ murein hydrolase activator NlpD
MVLRTRTALRTRTVLRARRLSAALTRSGLVICALALAAPLTAAFPLSTLPLSAVPVSTLPLSAPSMVALATTRMSWRAEGDLSQRQDAPPPAWRWPLDGTPRVVREFDPPTQPWLPGHRGVDLAAAPGAAIRAVADGVVRFSGPIAGRTVISIEHPDGLVTTYEPVTGPVAAGAAVTGGQPIGAVAPAHEGCPVGACLHWGLRSGPQYLDPLGLLRPARIRLLPLGDAIADQTTIG